MLDAVKLQQGEADRERLEAEAAAAAFAKEEAEAVAAEAAADKEWDDVTQAEEAVADAFHTLEAATNLRDHLLREPDPEMTEEEMAEVEARVLKSEADLAAAKGRLAREVAEAEEAQAIAAAERAEAEEAQEVADREQAEADAAAVQLGLYPIVRFQYSSTTLYQFHPIIFSSGFSKATIGYHPRCSWPSRRSGRRTPGRRG